ncbi:MAG: FadR family transcriptional regulator [Chloroflexi bacterium]|nr:FadR family transcriptional regulator [Chloroflexota bacterium]
MEPVGRQSVTNVVVQRVIEHIRSANLRPGDKLPPEKDLARDLQVSRASVREAMKSLAATGMVEMQHGLGTFVAKPSVLTLLAHGLFPSYMSTNEDLSDITAARRVFEPEMTAMAAIHATPADLAAMAEAMDTMDAQVSRGTIESQPMIDFHHAVLRAAGNQVLLEITFPIIRLLTELMPRILSAFGATPNSGILQHEIAMHKELFEAVRSGDPEVAKAAAIHHIDDAFLQAQRALGFQTQTADSMVFARTTEKAGVQSQVDY